MRSLPYALAAFTFLAHAQQASADIITYTYAGTVSFGTDYSGVFGKVGENLAGKIFKVVETFDTERTGIASSNGTSFSYQQGGSNFGLSALAATATISIGGSTPRSIMDDVKDSTQNDTNPGATPSNQTTFQGYHSTYENGSSDFYDESLQLSAYSSLITFDYTKPITLTSSDAAFSGTYSLSAFAGPFGNYTSFASANANLLPTSLTVSQVPLPPAAPLFGAALLGLAGLGYAARRMKAAPTA